MNKRRKKKNTIELTSLMDVIFIILMVVILGYAEKKGSIDDINSKKISIENEIKAQEDQLAEYEHEIEKQRSQLESEQFFNQATFLTITAKYTPSNPKERSIVITENDIDNSIPIDVNDPEKSYTTLKETIGGMASKTKELGKPVIINYSDEQVLYRDDVRIKEILIELMKNYPNIYESSQSIGDQNE